MYLFSNRARAVFVLVAIVLMATWLGLPALSQTSLDQFHITLDTLMLPILTPGDQYNLDFQLNGINGGSASISNLSVGSGSLIGLATTYGTVTPSSVNAFQIGPSSALSFNNELSQGFTSGDTISFDLSLNTTGAGSSNTPDTFVFGLFDNNQEFQTNGPSGFELATIDLNPGSLLPSDFALSSYTGQDGNNYSAAVSAVPEIHVTIVAGMCLIGITRFSLRWRFQE